ncbi:MAG TPA: protein kinase [Bryobacteraceae bacterium]
MSQMFGRYTVVGQLGRGAMGVVYLATDPVLNRQVAIKTVDLDVDDPKEREFLRGRLLRDARAAALLKHPNIVSVHDVFEDGDRAYVVMEYVEGDSLAAQLKVNPLPDAATILKVLGQMAEALDYTHEHGVIHRDIKPANVMIDAAGTAKIMDFGIARITDTRTCTPTGMVMGTVEYMAPEQIRGETVDGRVDEFSLAVVAYQMMTGSTLFGPNTMATLTYKIVNEAPPPPCTRNPALPRGVDAVLVKALAKTPSDRFATCCGFVGALAQAFSGAPTAPLGPVPMPAAVPQGSAVVAQPTQPVVPIPGPAAPARRFPWLVLAAVLLVLGLGAALAVWKPWNRTPQPPEPVAAVAPATPTPVPTPEPVATPQPQPPDVKPAKSVPTPAKVGPPEAAEELEPLPQPSLPKGGAKPAPAAAALQRGHEQMKSRDYPSAIQSFTKAIALRPNFAPAYYSRGLAHQDQEQNEMAIQDYSEAIRLAPDMAPLYAARGVCLVRLRRDADAWVDFQRALELKPDMPSALNGRGVISFRRKQYRMALADFDGAIKNNPGFAQAYQNRASAREAVGDLRGAADDRQREAELRKR